MKVAIFIIYIVSMIGIGLYCRRKTSSVSDFVLGGRNLGAWFTAFAFGTSYFSAVVFIGYAGQFGWSYGIASSWIGIGNAVLGSALAWMVMGKRTRIMTKTLNTSTMPEFFEKRFDSKLLKTISAIIIFIFLIPYTASVYNGLSRIFSMAFDVPYEACIIAMAVLTAVYVILGGYLATAINDFVQGIIMLFGISAVVWYAVDKQGGFATALSSLRDMSDSSMGIASGELASILGPDPINLFGVIILTSLGTWGLPQMVHKFYAIKDNKSIKRGTIISTVFAVVVAGGSYFLGGFGRLYNTASVQDSAETGRSLLTTLSNGKLAYDEIVPNMLLTCLPDVLIGIVVVLVLSASMSTLSSLVLTSSSTLTIDLIKPMMKNNMNDKKQISVMRVLIAAFLLLSVILAMMKNAYITTLMSISWGALAGAFLGPFLWGLFSKKTTATACLTSFVTGIGITVAHMFVFTLGGAKGTLLGINLASPINAGAFAMIVSLIVVPIVSLFTKAPSAEITEPVFAAVKNSSDDAE